MNSIVNGLIEAGHKVKILAVNSEKYHIKEKDIPQAYKDKTGIELVDIDLRINVKEAIKNLFTDKSYHVERFISEALRQKLIEILKKDQYDIVQLEMIYMAEKVNLKLMDKCFMRTHYVLFILAQIS